jgi:hypothetical protein
METQSAANLSLSPLPTHQASTYLQPEQNQQQELQSQEQQRQPQPHQQAHWQAYQHLQKAKR